MRPNHERDARIKELYLQGHSSLKVARMVGIKKSAVLHNLHKLGVKMRTTSEAALLVKTPYEIMRARALKYPINENFFHEETEETQYTIGLITADGCVHGNDAWSITLKEKDHFELIAELIGKRPLIYVKAWDTWRLQVSSRVMVSRLKELGITSRKSTRELAHSSLANSRHFWRGNIDGDGSLWLAYKIYPRVTASGSRKICRQFQHHIESHLEIPPNTISMGDGTHHTVYNTYDAIAIADYLYRDCAIALARKKAIADDWMSRQWTIKRFKWNGKRRYSNFLKDKDTNQTCLNLW